MKSIICMAIGLGLLPIFGNMTFAQQVAGPRTLPAQGVGVDASSADAELVPMPERSILEQSASYQSGWGVLRGDGSLHGVVHAFPGGGNRVPQTAASVTIESAGSVVGTATSDEEGKFVIAGLRPGLHTLRVDTGSCYAVYSLFLVPSQAESSSVMEVYCAGMPRSEVERVIAEMWAPDSWFESPGSNRARLLGPPMPSQQSPQVKMLNGQVNGQLIFPSQNWLPENHLVKVFRNGSQIASVPADEYGRFSFQPGSAGPVDIVAGGGAYGSMSIEIIEGDATLSSSGSQDGVRYVARRNIQASDVCLVPLTGEAGGAVPGEEVVLAEEGMPCCSAPMGGFMGAGGGYYGGGGGGGGFGWGGGLGGLLGAAGLAVGISALADDDDGFNFNVPSPLAP